jgi:phage tail tape-measure protein
MDELNLAAGEALKAQFMKWGCNNKNAKKNKINAWKELNSVLRQLR